MTEGYAPSTHFRVNRGREVAHDPHATSLSSVSTTDAATPTNHTRSVLTHSGEGGPGYANSDTGHAAGRSRAHRPPGVDDQLVDAAGGGSAGSHAYGSRAHVDPVANGDGAGGHGYPPCPAYSDAACGYGGSHCDPGDPGTHGDTRCAGR